MGKRYLVGLIGEGIQRSLTPDLHMREAQQLGVEYEYRIIDVLEPEFSEHDIQRILSECRAAGYHALNVTYPFKQRVLKNLAAQTSEVEELEATNLILELQDTIRGANTDWTGFQYALNQAIPAASRDLVLQVGVGGAGSATAYALLKWGVKRLVLADLHLAPAQKLAERYQRLFPKQQVIGMQVKDALPLMSQLDGVVQATPIGMHLHPGKPFEIDQLPTSAWLADVIYRPMETELVAEARERGNTVVPGGLMAVGQAADSLQLITGLAPNRERMRQHFAELLDDESLLTRARGI